jgi:flagellar basal-body rod protein FlgC
MTPGDAFSISASALSANRTRLNVIAENLANANTTKTPSGRPYMRRIVRLESDAPSFAQLLAGGAGSEGRGVKVAAVTQINDTRRSYMPGHPDADEGGYIEMPSVNPISEMTDLIAATRAYEANVTAMQALKSMAAKALELGR